MSETSVERSLGELTGLTKGLMENMHGMREDLRRMREENALNIGRVEVSLKEQIRELGDSVDLRFQSHGGRLDKLEAQDKVFIGQIAKNSAIGGGVVAALVAGVVELIKHVR
jgi:L-serine deaminase